MLHKEWREIFIFFGIKMSNKRLPNQSPLLSTDISSRTLDFQHWTLRNLVLCKSLAWRIFHLITVIHSNFLPNEFKIFKLIVFWTKCALKNFSIETIDKKWMQKVLHLKSFTQIMAELLDVVLYHNLFPTPTPIKVIRPHICAVFKTTLKKIETSSCHKALNVDFKLKVLI